MERARVESDTLTLGKAPKSYLKSIIGLPCSLKLNNSKDKVKTSSFLNLLPFSPRQPDRTELSSSRCHCSPFSLASLRREPCLYPIYQPCLQTPAFLKDWSSLGQCCWLLHSHPEAHLFTGSEPVQDSCPGPLLTAFVPTQY